MRSLVAAAAFLVGVSSAASHDALFTVRGAQLPASRAAAGYVQEVTGLPDGSVEVRIAAIMAPLQTESPYPLAGPLVVGVPRDFSLPPGLALELEGETTAWAAATRVLRWVSAHVAEDVHDREPQDAVSVLTRGRGRCSGMANAAAALLMAAGFEARTVSGLLIGDDVVVPHRWLECWLPGVGWVPSDPTLGFWVVTPRHMAFASSVVELPEVRVKGLVADQQPYLPRIDGRPLRPNQGAGLVCRLAVPRAGVVAVLRGGGGEVHRARLSPEARFEGILPGRWQLTVMASDVVVEQAELELVAGAVHSITVQF